MLAHSLIFLPAAGFVLAAAAGVFIRNRRERDDQRVRAEFKIDS
jgi:LPXTG-motif cell wall-anchored protein